MILALLVMTIMDEPYYYNLSSPPRSVPWPLRGQVLIGGFFGQFGWLWFGFTVIFLWGFGSLVSFNSLYFLVSSVETTPGTVSAVETSGASENETPVYANHYSFRVEHLETDLEGISYTTGRRFSEGNSVTIEYINSNPNISRIEGARSGTFSPWVLCFIIIFPLIGLIMIVVGLKRGLRANQLLKHGKLGLGTLIAKEPTNTQINERTVYKLTFEFKAADGQHYEAVAKSHQPYVLEDEEQEQLVYDPYNPHNAFLLDAMPGEPDIDNMGNIQVASMGRCLGALLVPTAVLLVNAFLIFTLILANL